MGDNCPMYGTDDLDLSPQVGDVVQKNFILECGCFVSQFFTHNGMFIPEHFGRKSFMPSDKDKECKAHDWTYDK